MPTQSLEWHVWSSSSGNNCHAVHWSLSSGASVYECTMGFFCLVPFHQPNPAYTISFDYWPLVCVISFQCIILEWHICPGRRSKYNISIYLSFCSYLPILNILSHIHLSQLMSVCFFLFHLVCLIYLSIYKWWKQIILKNDFVTFQHQSNQIKRQSEKVGPLFDCNMVWNDTRFCNFWCFFYVSKVGNHSRGLPESSLFNSYYTEV